MTNQELYNRVKSHLLQQNKRSANELSGDCLYRGPEGSKCAIGCLIEDENYSRWLEGRRVADPEVMRAAGLKSNQRFLANDLQYIHDSKPVPLWAVHLASIAYQYGLVP